MKYIVIIFILLAAGAGAGFYFMNKAKEEAAANSAASVQTRAVTRTTLEKVITANGKIASNRDVEIKCKASGEIIKLPFDVSQSVKKGDMLLELDPVDVQRALDQAEAALASSVARVEQAKLNYQQAQMNLITSRSRSEADLASAKAKAADSHAKAARTQSLYDAKPTPLASKEELETALTAATQADSQVAQAQASIAELDQQKVAVDSRQRDIDLAQAQLKQDQIKRDLQRQQLDYTKVLAPIDGVISVLNVQVGNIVQSGTAGNSGGTTVMTISDMSHIFVLASVDESDIGNVIDPATGREGQLAHVTVDAYPRQVFQGRVVRVASKGVNTSNVVTFEVKVEVIDEKKSLLKPEMTGTAKIVIDSRQDTLVVPIQAFMRKQDEPAPAAEPVAQGAASQPSTPAASGAGGGRGAGGRGGRGRAGSVGSLAGLNDFQPQEGTVSVLVDGRQEVRDIVVGMSNGESYEVISGDLKEGDLVILNSAGADSRWRQQSGPSPQQMGRMLNGRGGGGRR